jgi:hypothetical protein
MSVRRNDTVPVGAKPSATRSVSHASQLTPFEGSDGAFGRHDRGCPLTARAVASRRSVSRIRSSSITDPCEDHESAIVLAHSQQAVLVSTTTCAGGHVPHVSRNDDRSGFAAHDRPSPNEIVITKEKPMNRKTIKRFLVTVGFTAGFVTVTAGHAAAAMNHSEPTLRRN